MDRMRSVFKAVFMLRCSDGFNFLMLYHFCCTINMNSSSSICQHLPGLFVPLSGIIAFAWLAAGCGSDLAHPPNPPSLTADLCTHYLILILLHIFSLLC